MKTLPGIGRQPRLLRETRRAFQRRQLHRFDMTKVGRAVAGATRFTRGQKNFLPFAGSDYFDFSLRLNHFDICVGSDFNLTL
jgi:hypothetical protein